MTCPNCGGLTYDNTERVAGGWKGPLFKCRDAACGWVKWPPKGTKAAAPAKGPRWTWVTMSETYRRCLLLAQKHLGATMKDATAADVIAATATLFITAARDGVAEAAPAPKPEPVPAPADADDDDIPF